MPLLESWYASLLTRSQRLAAPPLGLSPLLGREQVRSPPTGYALAPPRPKLHGQYFKQPDRLAPFTSVLNSLFPLQSVSPSSHFSHIHTMAARALPSHLKPSAAEGGEGGFAPRHHGKTQSHVVSWPLIVQMHGTCWCASVGRVQ